MRLTHWIPLLALGVLVTACDNDAPPPRRDTDTCATPPCDAPANQAPVAVITGPTGDVLVGQEISLAATASTDADGDALTYLWGEAEGNPINNFLDGVVLNADTITFTPDQVGTYTFTVRVRDTRDNQAEQLEDTAEFTITVTQDEENPVNYPPAVTGAVVGSRFVDLSGKTALTLFVAGETGLDFQLLVADPEDDVITDYGQSGLVQHMSGANYTIPARAPSDVTRDTDGFASGSGQFWVDDGNGGVVKKVTVTVRYVPKAADGRAQAIFVDCDNIADFAQDGTLEHPFSTVGAGYQAAVASADKKDVYIAQGVCDEGDEVRVGFDGVALYGLFDPSAQWRRRSEPADRQNDMNTDGSTRFAAWTRIQSPGLRALLSTDGTPTGTGSLLIDGLSFNLDDNRYGVNVTLPNNATYTLTIRNSEFVGTATQATNAWDVPGGLYIQQGGTSSVGGQVWIQRNLFSVDTADDGSRFQAWLAPRVGDATFNGPQAWFLSNVVSAEIGFTTGAAYTCNEDSGMLFAVCLTRSSGGTTALSQSNYAMRNLFHIRALDNTANCGAGCKNIMLDAGEGGLRGNGNVFVPVGPKKFVFVHAHNGGGTAPYTNLTLNRFPDYNADYTWLLTGVDYTGTSYVCAAYMSSTLRLPGFLWATGGTCNTAQASTNLGNFNAAYATADTTAAGSQSWRLADVGWVDFGQLDWRYLTQSAEIPAESWWDFDGRYGAVDDVSVANWWVDGKGLNGVTGTSFQPGYWDAGPFEAGAPMY